MRHSRALPVIHCTWTGTLLDLMITHFPHGLMLLSYLYASDFPFKNFCKLAQNAETIRKKCLGKSNDAYSLSIRVQTIFWYLRFYIFYHNINVKENVFIFQSVSWKRHCTTHWREQHGWHLVIFDWFFLSMRMQVILDSPFAHPGSAPIGAGRKESSGTGLAYIKPSSLKELLSGLTLPFLSSWTSPGRESPFCHKVISSVTDRWLLTVLPWY